MSGLEVVAAVAAVVSAFHGGSELVKVIKEKRRKRQSQREFEEQQLQASLILGEQEIGSRYAHDIKEMGDMMVVGDLLARDLLLHIALNMQAEIIKGLQMAVQNPTVILNLRLLHEATITNRNETVVTLDELKQRLMLTRPMARQLQDVSDYRSPISTLPSTRANTLDFSNAIPDNHVPSAVTLGPQKESKQSRSSIARYLQTVRSNSTAAKPTTSTPTERPDFNYCRAFEELVRSRSEDRTTLMNDVDEVTMRFKGFEVGGRTSSQPRSQYQQPSHFGQRRGTLDVLQGDGSSQQTLHTQHWDSLHALDPQLPLNPWADPGSQDYSVFDQNVFSAPPQHPAYGAPDPQPYYQPQTSHRYSDSSNSSAPYSDMSRSRHDSDSSRTSYGSGDPRYSLHSPPVTKSGFTSPASPNGATQRHNDQYSAFPPYAVTEQTLTASIAPHVLPSRNPLRASPQNGGPVDSPNWSEEPTGSSHSQHLDPQRGARAPNVIAPFASPPDSPVPVDEDRAKASPTRPTLLPPEVRGPSSSHSSSSGHTVTNGLSSMPWHRTVSAPVVSRIRQPSIASTDSSGSVSIGILPRPVSTIPSSTIKSPAPGQEQMMNGRACKDNNYWGFCKGAWDVRVDIKKGLALRTMPSGLYNTQEKWECRSCNFRGNTYTIVHPNKKGKKETVVDPNIRTSECGIRYRWIFLAKSHVKKTTPDNTKDECNYGCVICSVETKVTSIFGNVETLFNHIYTHASDMSQTTMKQTRCIVGRNAGNHEDWDVNIPLFGDVNEME